MKNKTGKLTIAIFYLSVVLYSQATNPFISELLEQVNQQNLSKHVCVLSGADSVRINKINTIITSRQVGHPDHDKARDYLKSVLKEYGYQPEEVYFYWYDHEICNLLAIKPGCLYPNQTYILCAHYDSYNPTAGEPAPGADDNASGIAAVLESARILQNVTTDYSIIFAFWDAEEKGRWGSEHYAFNADQDNDTILGVINLDMIAYDPASQFTFSINTDTCAGSIDFANTLANLTSDYCDDLRTVIYNPGSMLSDHQKFWSYGFKAALISEAYRDGAQYLYYHTAQDTYEKLNFEFLTRMSRFALATISSLAGATTFDLVSESTIAPEKFTLSQNYPNPCNSSTTVRYTIPQVGSPTLILFNILGEELAVLSQQIQSAGSYEIELNLANFPTGLYFYQLRLDNYRFTRRMLIIK